MFTYKTLNFSIFLAAASLVSKSSPVKGPGFLSTLSK